MSLGSVLRKEVYVALHAQTRKFRIVKYLVIFSILGAVYLWKGLGVVISLLAVLFVVAIFVHLLFRWKSETWTKSWWLYTKVPFEDL